MKELVKKEFNGPSLKDAILKAAQEFDVDETSVVYKLLPEKSKIYGHKQKEFFIEAWVADDDVLERFKEFINLFIKEMELDLSFKFENGRDFLRVNFSGEDYKLLLYRNGNLLNALQYLFNRLFSDTIGKKIYCESENFRKNKESELMALSKKMAFKVKKTGREHEIKDLNPFERRVVHLAIGRFKDLESVSIGDDFIKTIVIRKKR